ncbi:MAG: CsbD family protein [Pseudomonadota bacterium]
MNPDELKGKWEQIKGKLHEKWAKLTDDDWQQVRGNKEKMVGKIQERYGIAKDQAEKELHDFFNKDKDHHH